MIKIDIVIKKPTAYIEEHSILEDIKHFSTTLPNSEYNKER